MDTIETFKPVDGKRAEGLANILELMETGDKMLHGLKDKLDYAKKMFDEAKDHFDNEDWGPCIGALIASAAIVESMESGENPADIFTRLTDEFKAETRKKDE
jgi:hypothetical protein